MVVHYTPESPDNKAIREQLEELKKLNEVVPKLNLPLV